MSDEEKKDTKKVAKAVQKRDSGDTEDIDKNVSLGAAKHKEILSYYKKQFEKNRRTYAMNSVAKKYKDITKISFYELGGKLMMSLDGKSYEVDK